MKKIIDLEKYLSTIVDGDKVFEFIKSIDYATPKGITHFNENLYVNVVESNTKEEFDGVFESHNEYIDVQVLIKGQEKMYYGDRRDMKIVKEYDSQKDYELLSSDKYEMVEYNVMQAVVFDVFEPHAPCQAVGKSQKILKAIVKVKNN